MTCRAPTGSACSPQRPARTRPRRTAIPTCWGTSSSGPYVVRSPELARVVVDPEGVAGYVVGAADTRAFEAWAEADWWPVLRAQYPALGDGTRDAEVIELIHRPHLADPAIVVEYPSHLHINLLERARGHGQGRTLVEWLAAELRSAGSRGVHLDVGAPTTTRSRSIGGSASRRWSR